MEVEFSLTMKDVLAFQRYHTNHSPSSARMFRLARSATIYLAIMGIVVLNFVLKEKGFDPMVCLWLSLPFLVVVIYLYRHRINAWAATRKLQEGRNAKVFETQRLTITPEAITRSTPFSTATTRWTALEKIAVTEDHAFFYLTTVAAYILPKHAFAHDWEFTEFVETAQGYAGPPGRGVPQGEIP